MSGNPSQLAKAVLALDKQFTALREVAVYIEEVGSLEQAKTEAERQAKAARLERDKAQLELADVMRALELNKSASKNAVAKAEETASQAAKDAEHTLGLAGMEAKAIVTTARENAETVLAEAAAERERVIGTAESEAQSILDMATEDKVLHESLTLQIATARETLATLDDGIAKLKSDYAKLIS